MIPHWTKMDDLIKQFSVTKVSDAATLTYPQIVRELKNIKENDDYAHERITYSVDVFRDNVFYFYYAGLMRDVNKIRTWAYVLHVNSAHLFAEWKIFTRIRSAVNGRTPIVDPDTGADYLSPLDKVRIFDNEYYTSIIGMTDDKKFYVIKVDYEAERQLHTALRSIKGVQSKALTAISFNEGGRLSPSQNKVIAHINNNNVTFMTGGAGTGKTSVIIHIINDWYTNEREFGLAIVSPTNMAAENIRDRLIKIFDDSILKRVYIGTIHSYTRNKTHPKFSLFIFEETSMYDNILSDMCAVNKDNVHLCKYLFAGDPNQLPPVARSSLLCRMTSWLFKDVVTLTDNFRSGDLIVRNSQSVLQTASASFAYLETNDNFTIRGFDKIEDTNFIDRIGGKFDDEVMFITYRANDSFNINKRIQEELLERGDYFEHADSRVLSFISRVHPVYHNNIICGYWNWQVGDRVRCLVNRPGIIYNGSIGKVCGFTNNEIRVKYKDRTIDLHYRKVWPAYCITVHTSQGKEWDTVVFCDCRNEGLLRSLFYVAITRPRHNAIIMRKKDKPDSDADLKHFNIIDDNPIMHDEMNHEEPLGVGSL